MNWKLRLKNKATLTALFGFIIVFAYQVCGLFGVVPPISQDDLIQIVGLLLTALVGLGVLVDPTTSGFGDSDLAMQYKEPRDDADEFVYEI